jgi:flagellar protein FlgJ
LAISPPGDIIMDVVKAADPSAVETARARLASLSNRVSGETDFSVPQASPVAPREMASVSQPKPEAFAKFEAMVLQTFLQHMMPKDTTSVYGEGMAGEMWQSLLAEKLGDAMASRGGIGIADRILKDHYKAGEQTVSLQGVSNDPTKPERDSQDMLSVALVQEIQRKVAKSLYEDRAATQTTTSR